MARFLLSALMSLLAASSFTAVPAAERPSEPDFEFSSKLELAASDLDAIRMDVLQRFPILAASPGIKFARGWHESPSGVSAEVVFFPHSETRGVKNALQAQCRRAASESQWSCPVVELRRYVRLETQEFEVRVVGDIDLDGVLALMEATRPAVLETRPGPSVDTLMIVVAADGGYVVGWGSEQHRETVTLQAHLRDGGDAANAAEWDVAVLNEE